MRPPELQTRQREESSREGSPTTLEYEGLLEIDPLRYGKAVQAVTVHTRDGKRVGVTMRYRPEHLAFANKRVRIAGHMARSSDDPRAQSYSYFEVTRIALAPGESPWDPIPTRVPPPPVVRSEAELRSLRGGWGAAVGRATFRLGRGGRKSERSLIETVTLTLDDGYTLTRSLHLVVRGDAPEYQDGARGTIVFRYTPGGERIVRPFLFCPGEEPACGAPDAQR